jgi:hypothetical protein
MQVVNTAHIRNGDSIQRIGVIREEKPRSLMMQRRCDRDSRRELIEVYRKRVEAGLALFEDEKIHILDRSDEHSPQRRERLLPEAS